jgi:hypothetical protein
VAAGFKEILLAPDLDAHEAAGDPHPGYMLEGDYYSVHQYVFAPDAAPGAVVTTADGQGMPQHSGPDGDTAFWLKVDAKTAPGAGGLVVTIQYGDTDDLDTVASWTTIATYTLASEKSHKQASMTNAAIPAERALRCNWTADGVAKDATVTLFVLRPLRTAVP